MAIVADNWYSLAFNPLSDATWAALPTFPTLPPTIGLAVRNASVVFAYCSDDAGPLRFAYLGGEFTVSNDTVFSVYTLQTKNNTTMGDGEEWTSMRTSLGTWLFYGSSSGIVRDLPASDTLGDFLTLP